MTSSKSQYVLLTPTAQPPKRGSALAAGLDVCADFYTKEGDLRRLFDGRDHHLLKDSQGDRKPCFVLKPGHRVLIPSGIAMSTSADLYTRVAPRSGLALKQGLEILGGVVDADYTGEIGIICKNGDPKHDIEISHGMRIAQLVLTQISLDTASQVNELGGHLRGLGGFGSTGI